MELGGQCPAGGGGTELNLGICSLSTIKILRKQPTFIPPSNFKYRTNIFEVLHTKNLFHRAAHNFCGIFLSPVQDIARSFCRKEIILIDFYDSAATRLRTFLCPSILGIYKQS